MYLYFILLHLQLNLYFKFHFFQGNLKSPQTFPRATSVLSHSDKAVGCSMAFGIHHSFNQTSILLCKSEVPPDTPEPSGNWRKKKKTKTKHLTGALSHSLPFPRCYWAHRRHSITPAPIGAPGNTVNCVRPPNLGTDCAALRGKQQPVQSFSHLEYLTSLTNMSLKSSVPSWR